MLPKTTLDIISKRAPPRMRPRYISALATISLYNNSDTRLAKQLRASSCINDRRPRRAKFSDTSKKKIGRQALENRLMHIDFDWIGPKVCKSYIDIHIYCTLCLLGNQLAIKAFGCPGRPF